MNVIVRDTAELRHNQKKVNETEVEEKVYRNYFAVTLISIIIASGVALWPDAPEEPPLVEIASVPWLGPDCDCSKIVEIHERVFIDEFGRVREFP